MSEVAVVADQGCPVEPQPGSIRFDYEDVIAVPGHSQSAMYADCQGRFPEPAKREFVRDAPLKSGLRGAEAWPGSGRIYGVTPIRVRLVALASRSRRQRRPSSQLHGNNLVEHTAV